MLSVKCFVCYFSNELSDIVSSLYVEFYINGLDPMLFWLKLQENEGQK